MATRSATSDIPTHPIDRREWLKAMLRARGWTHDKLAQHCGVSRQAVTKAFWQPMAAVEEAIAEILDRPLHELWPDRYTPAGVRVVRTLPRKSIRPVRRRNTRIGGAA